MLLKLGDKNVLASNIIRKLGGGKLSIAETDGRLVLCKTLNSNSPGMKLRWKKRVRKMVVTEYNYWLNKLMTELKTSTEKRKQNNIGKHIAQMGLGTSVHMTLNNAMSSVRTITHTDSCIPMLLKTSIRRIKAGLIANTTVMREMYGARWHAYDFA